MYRVRLVFNTPVNREREHPFYSVNKETLEEALQIINDLPRILYHTNSVQIHESYPDADGVCRVWQILSPSSWIKDSPLVYPDRDGWTDETEEFADHQRSEAIDVSPWSQEGRRWP